ncbi:MAG: hypothetical protein IPN53_18620 [Comamonadaceae bacterium]|nr:hypothetical protein [Comamonadaceae bacterium]
MGVIDFPVVVTKPVETKELLTKTITRFQAIERSLEVKAASTGCGMSITRTAKRALQ